MSHLAPIIACVAWFGPFWLALASSTAVAGDTDQQPAPSATDWHYGAFVDGGFAKDFNDPVNHLFRSRGTTPRVDEVDLNMAAAYVRKIASESSPWGLEITGQAGQDSKAFGFSPTAPNAAGADWLRHLGPANVSYLTHVGRGLSVQGGIFSSLIGYDSLYAKDNFNETRPWGADFTPYLMLGVNAAYPVRPNLTATAFVVNGYWHLADANDVPSIGGQVAYRASDAITVKETVLYGPHQSNTALTFWRFFSDTIVERKRGPLTTAAEFQVGTENVDEPANARATWVSAQLPVHLTSRWPVSATIRPEFCRDQGGRWTGFDQSVAAVTTTVEYRRAFRQAQTIVRVEHRYDHSSGTGGGFFRDGDTDSGAGLTPGQHLFMVSVILSVEGSAGRE